MIIKGWNDFYDGWLAQVFLQPDDESKSESWRDGWKMAQETGPSAVLALQEEIQRKHIIVGDTVLDPFAGSGAALEK